MTLFCIVKMNYHKIFAHGAQMNSIAKINSDFYLAQTASILRFI